MRSRVTAHLEGGDEVTADYYAAYTRVALDGSRLPMPAWINVQFGDVLDLRGAPEVVLRVLHEALLSAREAAGTEDVITDLGDEA